MMGHREPLKSGAEYDTICGWRRVLCYMQKPRVTHSIKRQLSKRVRREAKTKLRIGDGGTVF